MRPLSLALAAFAFTCASAANFTAPAAAAPAPAIAANQLPMLWEYDTPASKYWEGTPIGTGRFAAMIPGGVASEVIPFNDETLWTGGPYNPNNPEGPKVLAKVREAALAKKWKEADDLAWGLSSKPVHVQFYQAMARLNFQYPGHDLKNAKNYRRSLDMDNAIAETSYELDGVRYTRRVFASFPDQVIV
ncbi:MAG: glycoside hydrolase family 95 protein, partial [Puniceicoccales bacterium]|nr:glycoside hydrolase family 95 protein [Puniceicoccales bacterium]